MPISAASVLVSDALGVNLGTMILLGVSTAIISMTTAGVIWGRFIGNKIFTELPQNVKEIHDQEEGNLPSFVLVLGVVLVSVVLILFSTLAEYMPFPQEVKDGLKFLGEPFLTLTIATLFSMYLLGLRPVGMILLVIASGGVIRWMLQDSGLENVIGPMLENSDLPLILVAFFIALLVRASVGSSIVAITMASGIMASMPAVMGRVCCTAGLCVWPSAEELRL